jgi:type IV secretion system protein VirB4
LQLNPLMLADTPLNKEFLSLWVSTLIDPKASTLNASSLGFFQQLVNAIYALPQPQRRLGTLLQMVREQDATLASSLGPWVAGKARGELFDMPIDTLAPGNLYGINLAPWANDDTTLVPLVSYLLHRLTSLLTGTPVMLVLDEGFHLLKTPLYGPRATAWFDHLSANNAAAMLMTSDIDGSSIYPYSAALVARSANVFAMHDAAPGDGYFSLGFSEQEIGAIAHMVGPERRALLKRGSEVTMLRADLACLSADQRSVLAGKVPQPTSAAPEDVLKHLMQTPLGAAV